MKNQRIFITGATGFIGRHLALELAKDNQVAVLVRGPRSDEKDKEFLSYGIKIVWGDLLDSNTYAAEIKNMDYVFHLAALFKIDAGKEQLYNANVLGTRALLETCKDSGLKRFIHFSTAYVSAGREERDNIAESHPYSAGPRNWYEWSKAEAEKIALRYYKEHHLPITIIRPATVYGPGNLYGWHIAVVLIWHKKIFLSNGGKNKIHFVSVSDVVKAAVYLAEREGATGEIYNICDERPYSQREAVVSLCKVMKIDRPLFSLPKSLFRLSLNIPLVSGFFYGLTPEVADFYLDNHTFSNKKLKDAGFVFLHPEFKDGLEETFRWYAEHNMFVAKNR